MPGQQDQAEAIPPGLPAVGQGLCFSRAKTPRLSLSSLCLRSAGGRGPERLPYRRWVPAARGSACPLPQRGVILPTARLRGDGTFASLLAPGSWMVTPRDFQGELIASPVLQHIEAAVGFGSAPHYRPMAVLSGEMPPSSAHSIVASERASFDSCLFSMGKTSHSLKTTHLQNELEGSTAAMPWRNRGHLCLLCPRCHGLCTVPGFAGASWAPRLLCLGSAIPSSFAINGVINTYCCLLIWRGPSAHFAPVCW